MVPPLFLATIGSGLPTRLDAPPLALAIAAPGTANAPPATEALDASIILAASI